MRVYLSLGSNLGDRAGYIEKSIRLINEKAGTVIKRSSFYESDAWGFSSENKFLNIALELETDLSPENLLSILKNIEIKLGRIKNNTLTYQSRVIDIDIIFYEQLILKSENLQIPHPLMQERNFVLEPLKEIGQNITHPILGKTIETLSKECKDEITISKKAFK